MARILPSDISPLVLAGAHSGELQTLALLHAQLGPEYAVFHSVHWRFSQGPGSRFGEIDFILDEGQDFEADRLEILKLFLAEAGRILWLDDPDQNLLGKPPVELPGFVRLHSRHNYRSPYGIGRVMRRHLPLDFESANLLPGLGVSVHPYREADDQAKHLVEVVGKMISLGFSPEEIVILSLRGVDQSPLWTHERIGRRAICRFTGVYQPDSVQIWTDSDITLDSLYLFKGQDAPAVIVTGFEDRKTPKRRAGDGAVGCVGERGSGIGKRLGSAEWYETAVSEHGVALDHSPSIGTDGLTPTTRGRPDCIGAESARLPGVTGRGLGRGECRTTKNTAVDQPLL